MTRTRAARAGFEVIAADAALRHGDGGPTSRSEPPVANGILAVILFMAAEIMLFTGLLGAFVLYRTSSPVWPPPGQPLLPIGVTLANTAALLLSAVSMHYAIAGVRRGDIGALKRGLLLTAGLGLGFVVVQGFEWVNLVAHGLTLSSSNYGATFYTLIGLHAAHVVGAAVWLLAVLAATWAGRFSRERHVAVQVCGVYWYFVCGLWVVLFGVVYLA